MLCRRRRRASRRRAMVAIYACYEGPASRQDARPVGRRWRRTTARPAAAGERLAIEAGTDIASAWRATAAAIRAWLDQRASTDATPSSSCRSSSSSIPCAALWRRAAADATRRTARTWPKAWALRPTRRRCADASPPIDRLIARKLLLGQRWGVEWSRRDGLGFDQAIGRLVATVHELLRAMATKPPAGQAAAWVELERTVAPGGRRERDLAAIAVRWAALAPPPRTDALFGLRPSAFIAVEAGWPRRAGRIACSRRPPRRASPSSLDPPEGACSTGPASRPLPALGARPGLSRTRRSRPRPRCCSTCRPAARPVALVAHDRLLVRRVHES